MLTPRFHRPSMTPDIIARPRLTELLERHAFQPLIIVCAPAGYGKSMVVSAWLEQHAGAYSWLSLDEDLNDLPTFLEHFLEAIERGVSDSMPQTKQLIRSSHLLTVKAISEQIANEVSHLREHLVLVLDDYHKITNPDVPALINALLKYPTSCLQLVLIARRDPPLQLKKLRLYGGLLELRMQDLALAPEEFRELLIRYDIQLPAKEDQESLLRWTEGWLLGIKIMLTRQRLKGSKLEFDHPSLLSQNIGLATEYLTNQLPSDLAYLLQVASLCDRFNEALLDRLFQLDNSPAMEVGIFIGKLKGLNLFLITEDEEGGWYRFHHLFQDLLRKRFCKEHPERCRQILSVISSWFAEKGAIGQAITYAVKAKDYDRACDLISQHRKNMLAKDRWWEVQKWLTQIPEDIRKKKAGLLLARIWILEYLWQVQDVPYLLNTLEQVLEDHPDPNQRSEFLFHKGFYHTFVLADGKTALPLLEESKALFPDTSSFGARRELPLATARQMSGKSGLALRSLDQLEKEHPLLSYMHLRIGLSRIFIHLLDGNMEQAEQATGRYVFVAGNSEFHTMEAFGWYTRANVLFQSLSVEGLTALSKKMLASRGTMDFWAYFDALAGFIISRYLTDRNQEIEENMQLMKRQAEQMKSPFFKYLAESTQHRLNWLAVKGNSALDWAEGDKKFPLPRRILFTMEVPELTRIRILVTNGNARQVACGLRWLKKVKDFLKQIHNQYHEVDLALLEAIAHYRMEDIPLAIESLRKAEKLAIERNYIRPLAELKCAVPELWSMVDKDTLPTLLLATVSDNSREFPRSMPPTVKTMDGQDPLTSREIEIVNLVVQGLRNKEIAAQLHISLATVKSHLSRIFRKLDVPNRTTLVLKVKE